MSITLLPYRLIEYTTDLNERQIGEVLDASVLTGFSLFGFKPYYGGFTNYGFSVRRTRGRLKKESLGPSIRGAYDCRDGQMKVTIQLSPHPALIGAFAFLFCPMALLWALSIPEFFRTWDIGILVGGVIPAAAIYGIFWIVFQVQCSFDLGYWKQVLRLREVPVYNTALHSP